MVFVLNAVVLYILISVFSRGVEQAARFKILGIAIAATTVEALFSRVEPWLLGAILQLVVSGTLIWVALHFWCEVSRSAATKVVASYLAYRIVVTFVLLAILGAVGN